MRVYIIASHNNQNIKNNAPQYHRFFTYIFKLLANQIITHSCISMSVLGQSVKWPSTKWTTAL